MTFSVPSDRRRDQRAERRVGKRSRPFEQLHHALELEQQGFIAGAVCALRCLRQQLDAVSEPRLYIHTMYWLAALLTVNGELEEARELADEGFSLAAQQGAVEEMDVLADLRQQLGD